MSAVEGQLNDLAQIKQAIVDVENIYDEVEIDDMEYEEDEQAFRYPCPCGDRFSITLKQLYEMRTTDEDREKCIAICPSCSLQVKVIFDEDALLDYIKDNDLQGIVDGF
mmetsp:Transcript_21749/g.33575  ORF Transcript_21749/g.33575 Transcript_21749/m.33575 type:complete len:109 (-) Transcript_21749:62-388(-)|eukprot:CAMPEP_0170481798 /NCGR_PEP_ID=MMETSP0208-20121228/2102_1 /TAXON_ID=197538 /ORGANISM="Strombidium inclinatum, Strain S3" /LENGTH=108 /DNA_ID=CAMNT_0010754565 /DNA_START=25 /DNA_END=351 /DNA_ORIENTATION=+